MSDDMTGHMTLERFCAIIDAYGTAFMRWPEEEREDAFAFMQQSAEAQSYLTDAEHLDVLLGADDGRAASDALKEKILSQAADVLMTAPLPAAEPARQAGWMGTLANVFGDIDLLEWSWKRMAAPLCVMIVAGCLGLATGLYTNEAANNYAFDDEDIFLIALQSPDYGFDVVETF